MGAPGQEMGLVQVKLAAQAGELQAVGKRSAGKALGGRHPETGQDQVREVRVLEVQVRDIQEMDGRLVMKAALEKDLEKDQDRVVEVQEVLETD